MALRTEARGWGPDVTEITITCPEPLCTWGHTYDDTTTIGDMVERVTSHEHRYRSTVLDESELTYAHEPYCNTIHDGPDPCPPPRESVTPDS
jgi:hypothetical protein